MDELDFLPKKHLDYSRNILLIFSIYRIALILVTVGVYLYYRLFFPRSVLWPGLIIFLGCIYLAFAVWYLFLVRKAVFSSNQLAVSAVIQDILILSFLMYANNYMAVTYGILMNISIAAASLIVAGRISILLAALGAISVLLIQALLSFQLGFSLDLFQRTGLVGITFFITAIITYTYSNRARRSEEIVKQSIQDVATLEQINSLIVKNMQQGILVIDDKDRIAVSNQAAWYLLNIPSRIGKPLLSDIAPALATCVQQWRENPSEFSYSQQVVDLGILPKFISLVDANKQRAATLILLEDSAELSQQAQQIKLASLGRLTGSIAHEIRNPLSAISYAAQLLDEPSNMENKDRLVQIINNNCQRVNEIIENILQLSRRKEAIPKLIDLRIFLADLKRQMLEERSEKIFIDIFILSNRQQILFDPSQLKQVLYKLCENAFYYSKAQTGTSSVKLVVGESIPAGILYLDVVDFGPGVKEDFGDYIFEPFYTTKPEGTGLGLYIAKELCQINGARLNYCRTEKGESCFRIIFSKLS